MNLLFCIIYVRFSTYLLTYFIIYRLTTYLVTYFLSCLSFSLFVFILFLNFQLYLTLPTLPPPLQPVFLNLSAMEKDTGTKFGDFSNNFIENVLICAVVRQQADCCYGNKVLQHCFVSILQKKHKSYHINANYWPSDWFLLQIRF